MNSRRTNAKLLTAVTLLLTAGIAPSLEAVSLPQLCRRACRDERATCTGPAEARHTCQSEIVTTCVRDGIWICLGPDELVPTQRAGRVSNKMAPPSNLLASAPSSTAIQLTWQDNSTLDVIQDVERSTAPLSGFRLVAQLGGNVQSFLDSGLQPSTTFYYRIRSHSRRLSSRYSNTTSETTSAGGTSTTTTTSRPTTSTSTTLPTTTTTATTTTRTTTTTTGSTATTTSTTSTTRTTTTTTLSPITTTTTSTTTTIAGTTTTTLALTGTHRWSKGFGGPGFDQQIGVGIGTDGGSILVGQIAGGTADFGGGPRNFDPFGVAVAKYSAQGQYVWAQAMPGAHGAASDVAADGSVAVVGSFSNTISFGGQGLTSAGSTDVFVVKYAAADGSPLWARRFGTAGGADQAVAVTVDRDGGVIVSAVLQGQSQVDLGSGLVGPAMMVRYSASGIPTWSRSLGVVPSTMATSGDHLVLGGSFVASTDLGCGPLVPRAWTDGFLASYSLATGACQWSRALATRASTFGECRIASIATAADDGTIVIGGTLTETLDLGGGALTSVGANDMLLAQFSPTGAHQWSRAFGGQFSDAIRQVKLDSAHHVVVAGAVASAVDFGGGARTISGASDIFLAKFSATGSHLWSDAYGSTSEDRSVSLGVSPVTNEIALSVDAYQRIWLGGSSQLTLTAAASNLTLARYTP